MRLRLLLLRLQVVTALCKICGPHCILVAWFALGRSIEHLFEHVFCLLLPLLLWVNHLVHLLLTLLAFELLKLGEGLFAPALMHGFLLLAMGGGSTFLP